MIAIVNKTVKI